MHMAPESIFEIQELFQNISQVFKRALFLPSPDAPAWPGIVTAQGAQAKSAREQQCQAEQDEAREPAREQRQEEPQEKQRITLNARARCWWSQQQQLRLGLHPERRRRGGGAFLLSYAVAEDEDETELRGRGWPLGYTQKRKNDIQFRIRDRRKLAQGL